MSVASLRPNRALHHCIFCSWRCEQARARFTHCCIVKIGLSNNWQPQRHSSTIDAATLNLTLHVPRAALPPILVLPSSNDSGHNECTAQI
eukprot:3191640-Pleurochrysis_carterae.AAC.2